jgi:uncharacterized protein YukE
VTGPQQSQSDAAAFVASAKVVAEALDSLKDMQGRLDQAQAEVLARSAGQWAPKFSQACDRIGFALQKLEFAAQGIHDNLQDSLKQHHLKVELTTEQTNKILNELNNLTPL